MRELQFDTWISLRDLTNQWRISLALTCQHLQWRSFYAVATNHEAKVFDVEQGLVYHRNPTCSFMRLLVNQQDTSCIRLELDLKSAGEQGVWNISLVLFHDDSLREFHDAQVQAWTANQPLFGFTVPLSKLSKEVNFIQFGLVAYDAEQKSWSFQYQQGNGEVSIPQFAGYFGLQLKEAQDRFILQPMDSSAGPVINSFPSSLDEDDGPSPVKPQPQEPEEPLSLETVEPSQAGQKAPVVQQPTVGPEQTGQPFDGHLDPLLIPIPHALAAANVRIISDGEELAAEHLTHLKHQKVLRLVQPPANPYRLVLHFQASDEDST